MRHTYRRNRSVDTHGGQRLPRGEMHQGAECDAPHRPSKETELATGASTRSTRRRSARSSADRSRLERSAQQKESTYDSGLCDRRVRRSPRSVHTGRTSPPARDVDVEAPMRHSVQQKIRKLAATGAREFPEKHAQPARGEGAEYIPSNGLRTIRPIHPRHRLTLPRNSPQSAHTRRTTPPTRERRQGGEHDATHRPTKEKTRSQCARGLPEKPTQPARAKGEDECKSSTGSHLGGPAPTPPDQPTRTAHHTATAHASQPESSTRLVRTDGKAAEVRSVLHHSAQQKNRHRNSPPARVRAPREVHAGSALEGPERVQIVSGRPRSIHDDGALALPQSPS
ncbi:hypothetical protein B0H10DRAFT_2229114 [Mycena sp. CBHHK59/15]|nr:hypothetical protein B0H10DRAFT_2229114 [Mycena sp. CBHHK59/15]